MIGKIKCQCLFYRYAAAELPCVFVIYPQQFNFSVTIFKNARAANIAVENKRFHRVGIPKRVVIQHIDGFQSHDLALFHALGGEHLIFLNRHRFCVQIALHKIAADGFEIIRLGLCFHTFGNDRHSQPFCHTHNRLQDIAPALRNRGVL